MLSLGRAISRLANLCGPHRSGLAQAWARHLSLLSWSVCRPSRTARGCRRSPFDCDSTSGTDAHEAHQAHRPALRSITSLPSAPASASSSMAAAGLPPLPQSTQRAQQSQAPGEGADRPALTAALLPELPTGSLERQAKHAERSSGSPQATAGTESSVSEEPGIQDSSSSKPDGPPALCRRPPKSVRAEGRGLADTGGQSSGVDESAPQYGVTTSAAGRVQGDVAQDLGSWLWRPWMWAGLKRGIKRRAAQC